MLVKVWPGQHTATEALEAGGSGEGERGEGTRPLLLGLRQLKGDKEWEEMEGQLQGLL